MSRDDLRISIKVYIIIDEPCFKCTFILKRSKICLIPDVEFFFYWELVIVYIGFGSCVYEHLARWASGNLEMKSKT